ncbi:MAG: hypothetical protein GX638_16030 [Crenarchaeota archaeon]|nr:hypothetical protein [Thermoproteota archaeon]
MGYDLQAFMQDYISRTRFNRRVLLSVSKKAKTNNGNDTHNGINFKVYEVTHLLNSFFGVLIVPFEAFNLRTVKVKGKSFEENYELEERENKRRQLLYEQITSKSQYMKIRAIVRGLIKSCRYRSTYTTRIDSDPLESDEVFVFIKRLRNSLSHGGREGLSFLPIKDIETSSENSDQLTHVIFHDEYTPITNGQIELKAESYIKLTIVEIERLFVLISGLFSSISQELAFNTEQYLNRVTDAEYYLKHGTHQKS